MVRPPRSFRRFALLTVAGVACSRVGELYLFPLEGGEFRISLGHVALVLLMIAAIPLYSRPASGFFWWLLAVVCDQAVYLVVAERGLGFYSAPSVIGAVAIVALLMASQGALVKRSGAAQGGVGGAGASMRYAAVGGVIAVVLISRAIHSVGVQVGIPNEDRSMMVGGFEVHHINVGVALVWIAALLREGGVVFRAAGVVTTVALTVGLGLVVDQVAFYALREGVDAAYDGTTSRLGAAVGVAVIATVLLAWPSPRVKRVLRQRGRG